MQNEFCTLVCDNLLDRYSKKSRIFIFVFTTRSLLFSGFIPFLSKEYPFRGDWNTQREDLSIEILLETFDVLRRVSLAGIGCPREVVAQGGLTVHLSDLIDHSQPRIHGGRN